jgi:hypothetical protein
LNQPQRQNNVNNKETYPILDAFKACLPPADKSLEAQVKFNALQIPQKVRRKKMWYAAAAVIALGLFVSNIFTSEQTIQEFALLKYEHSSLYEDFILSSHDDGWGDFMDGDLMDE